MSSSDASRHMAGEPSKLSVAKKSTSSMKSLVAGLDLSVRKSISNQVLIESEETNSSEPSSSSAAVNSSNKLKRSTTVSTSLSLTAINNPPTNSSKSTQQSSNCAEGSVSKMKKTANDFVYMLAKYEEFSSYFNDKFGEFASKTLFQSGI
jgi:hypothetical protein